MTGGSYPPAPTRPLDPGPHRRTGNVPEVPGDKIVDRADSAHAAGHGRPRGALGGPPGRIDGRSTVMTLIRKTPSSPTGHPIACEGHILDTIQSVTYTHCQQTQSTLPKGANR